MHHGNKYKCLIYVKTPLLEISQSVSTILLALLKRSPNTFGHFPTRHQYTLGTAQMVSKTF
jgi:hypothetical protein